MVGDGGIGGPTAYGGRVAVVKAKGMPIEEGPRVAVDPGLWIIEEDWIGKLEERAPAREFAPVPFWPGW